MISSTDTDKRNLARKMSMRNLIKTEILAALLITGCEAQGWIEDSKRESREDEPTESSPVDSDRGSDTQVGPDVVSTDEADSDSQTNSGGSTGC